MSTKNADAFPHYPDQIRPEWLTNRLKLKKLLAQGRVKSVVVKPLGGVWLAQSALINLTRGAFR